MGLTTPGHKESVNDYQGVLVPLAQASRHSTVAAEYARRRSAEGQNSSSDESLGAKDKASEGSGEEGMMRTSSGAYNPYTIEGLRAEVLGDVAASGHDCSYDCKFKLNSISSWG